MDRKQIVTINMMHTCPMTTGMVPHVGGPVIGPGSAGVTINGTPIALQGDMCQCQGPPDTITQGCPRVTINGVPIAVQQSPTAHGGIIPQGVTGVVVVSKNETVFEMSQKRKPMIYNLQWIKDTLVVRDSKKLKIVTLGADTRNIADGEEVSVKVQDFNQQIKELSGKVANNRVEVEWEIEVAENEEDDDTTDTTVITRIYYTDEEGKKIYAEDLQPDTVVHLVIKGQNLAGKTGDLELSNAKVDFEHQGVYLENDILDNYTLESDYNKIKLKVIKPKKD